MVEVRDGLVERNGRQVGQVFLEAAERPAGLACLLGLLRDVDDVAVADEPVGAPEMAVRGNVTAPPRLGMDQVERFTLGVAAGGIFQLASQVARDFFEIRHQALRVVKDKMVDALENEPLGQAAAGRFDEKGFVDMADFDEPMALIFGLGPETLEDLAQVMLRHGPVPRRFPDSRGRSPGRPAPDPSPDADDVPGIRHPKPGFTCRNVLHPGFPRDDHIIDGRGKVELGPGIAPAPLQEFSKTRLQLPKDAGGKAPEVHRGDFVTGQRQPPARPELGPRAGPISFDLHLLDHLPEIAVAVEGADATRNVAVLGKRFLERVAHEPELIDRAGALFGEKPSQPPSARKASVP